MYFKVLLFACFVAGAYSDTAQLILQVVGNRIIGGEDALPGQFPHQVSLQWGRKPDVKDVHFCGGTILTEEWILTAAHCLFFVQELPSNGSFVVKAGKHDLAKKEHTEQVVAVDKYYTHKLYSRELHVGPYDIGLIKLQTPLQLNPRVTKAVLPRRDSEPFGTVTLSGWGAVNSDGDNPVSPTILQTVKIPIVDRNTCNQAVKDVFIKEGQKIKENMVKQVNICTGPLDGGTSACGGDSGGPLVKKNQWGQSVVVGIVSWGMKPCGRIGAPAVFTRVSTFVDWIVKIIIIESD